MRSLTFRRLALTTALTLAGAVQAADSVSFDTCTDVAGHTVAAAADYAQTVLVTIGRDNDGLPVIRYNPALLPNLSPAARQFFYAHACAQLALDGTAAPTAPLAGARRADCVGVATLIASGLLKRDELAGLQDQLTFTADEWPLLPGPPRSFDLTACRSGGVLRLPAATAPSAGQTTWNACARACADRLWSCQKGCRGEACDSACGASHDQCAVACGAAPGGRTP
jgi:hypothetical protein